jgi:DNA gyrase subunit A
VMLFTKNGMAVRFDESEVRSTGRTARGVRGVSLRGENDAVVGCEIVTGKEVILIVCENGFGKKSEVEEFRKCHRGGVGVRSIITNERNGSVVGALAVTDRDNLLMMSRGGQTIRIKLQDVRVMGRNTQGVRLANLKDDILVAVQKIERTEDDHEGEQEGDQEGESERLAPEEQNPTQELNGDDVLEDNS